MNWFGAIAIAAALLVSGCGSGSAQHLVHMHGQLVRIGGPLPGGAVVLAGVRLRFEGTGASVTVRTGPEGRFAFHVAPGTYRVTIVAGGPQADGRPIQPVPRVIRVPHTGRRRLVVNIK